MSNMSYCRFRNTLADLRDCYESMSEVMNLEHLSDEEQKAAQALIKLCRRIADDWDES
jgi:hypothetical protein